MSTNAIPALITALDEVLELEQLVVNEDDAADPLAYGQDLSFDWRELRFRVTAEGNPIVAAGQETMANAAVKAVLTPRYEVPLYGNGFGAEILELVGLPAPIALAQLEEMIRSAIEYDRRVASVNVLELQEIGDAGVSAKIVITDFNGRQLNVPEVVIRYG